MKRLASLTSLALIIGLASAPLSAHVGWKEINSVSCDNPYVCNNAPIRLIPGARIDVIYDVIIKHGSPIKIEFSPSGDFSTDNIVLQDGLPEISGLNSTQITLPNIECAYCSLRVAGSGYSGATKVILSNSDTHSSYASSSSSSASMQDNNDIEVDHLVVIPEDNVLQLMWIKVKARDTLILIAEEAIEATPLTGTDYQVQDVIGNAKVAYLGDDYEVRTAGLKPDTKYFFKIFSVGSNPHYSEGTSFNAMTKNIGNNPPWPSLSLMQNNTETNAIDPDQGMTTITLNISDADPDDWHQIDWTGTSTELMDTNDAEGIISFSPVDLTPGDYVVKATVSDSGIPSMSKSVEKIITVMATHSSSQSTPSNSNTSNSNTDGSNKGGGSSQLLIVILFSLISYAGQRWQRKKALSP